MPCKGDDSMDKNEACFSYGRDINDILKEVIQEMRNKGEQNEQNRNQESEEDSKS